MSQMHALRLVAAFACGLAAQCLGGLASAEVPDDLVLTSLLTGLDRPLAARHAGDGSGRLFIVSQEGPIQIYVDGALLPTPFLDLTGVSEDPVFGSNEYGLLGLAFHPDYASTGFFYVNYTVQDSGRKTRVVRYQVSGGDADIANPASAFLIFEIAQPFSNHNGGNILFGHDGYLYIGLGDGGGQLDPDGNGQNRLDLLGKFLRIDVDSVSAQGGATELCGSVTNYSIPPDNPFAADDDGACNEIWSIGWRNPWRFSFDRALGDLLVGDVGQYAIEEVDFEPAGVGGRNYGWACREGSIVQNFDTCLDMPLVNPVLEYANGGSDRAVTGGYRYRGQRISGLGGIYIYADYNSGKIWFTRLSTSGSLLANDLWQDTSYFISSFGEDEAGELYLLGRGSGNDDGALLRFESPSSVFADGFESGNIALWNDPDR